MEEIKIGHYLIGKNHPPFIVAELSANHNQSLERALTLVHAAKEAGAHAVKLQTYTPDTLTLNVERKEFLIDNPSSLWFNRHLFSLYQEAYLPWDWHVPIFEKCRELNLVVFSTPFDETAVDYLESLNVPCYKIGSPEIIDLPLIQYIAKKKKPLILSTGGATFTEIAEAIEVAKSAGCEEIVLLKCTIAYPSKPEEANLLTLSHLANSFQTLIGLSDHCLENNIALASVALGACIIEKHLTLSREDPGVDTKFSIEPSELALLVRQSKEVWEALGRVHYGPLLREETTHSHRPSLYFIEDLKAGAIVKDLHVRSLRPSGGLLPKELSKILGMPIVRNVKRGDPVTWDIFKTCPEHD